MPVIPVQRQGLVMSLAVGRNTGSEILCAELVVQFPLK